MDEHLLIIQKQRGGREMGGKSSLYTAGGIYSPATGQTSCYLLDWLHVSYFLNIMLIKAKKTTRFLLIDSFLFLTMSTGFQGSAASTSPWVWGECDPTVSRREVGDQTRAAAQSHTANFALKCPRCRTSGQVGGHPLQSCPRRNTHRCIDEPNWTQEEPVVAMLGPQDSPPSFLPPSPVYRAHITWIHFTLALFFFFFFPFERTTQSFLCHFSLHGRTATSSLSIRLSLSNTQKEKDYAMKLPTPLYVCFFVFSTAREDLLFVI